MSERIDEEVLIALVSPWLPGASVDDVSFQTTCGCYSEWTTDPPYFHVTFRAPRPTGESETMLAKLVSALESFVQAWAGKAFSWSGCECCREEGHYKDPPDVVVRIIPEAEGA